MNKDDLNLSWSVGTCRYMMSDISLFYLVIDKS